MGIEAHDHDPVGLGCKQANHGRQVDQSALADQRRRLTKRRPAMHVGPGQHELHDRGHSRPCPHRPDDGLDAGQAREPQARQRDQIDRLRNEPEHVIPLEVLSALVQREQRQSDEVQGQKQGEEA